MSAHLQSAVRLCPRDFEPKCRRAVLRNGRYHCPIRRQRDDGHGLEPARLGVGFGRKDHVERLLQGKWWPAHPACRTDWVAASSKGSPTSFAQTRCTFSAVSVSDRKSVVKGKSMALRVEFG